jgi:integrase
MMAALPRYVQQRVSPSGGITYRFNPPQSLVDAGVVSRETIGTNLKEVNRVAKLNNKLIDDWRDDMSQILRIKDSSTVKDLCDYYYMSNDFSMLRDSTKIDYKYFLGILCDELGKRKYQNVSSKVAKAAYEQWVKRGVSFANHICTVSSRVYNYAIQMEHATTNPFSNIKRKAAAQRKVVWERDHVIKFLDTAYKSFEHRNMGLIVQMAYEWCQRMGDMRNLTWNSLDLNNQQLSLEQSKRRANVFLPISDELTAMLVQQKKDYGFQPYVAPHPRAIAGSMSPYAMERLSKVGRSVMRLAGLPEELRLMDLRRTGVTEMVDAGVSIGQVMSVTGHTHVSSVKPYMKHTFTSANSALTKRNSCVQSNTVSDTESITYEYK